MAVKGDDPVEAAVEAAMVRIRRRQARRTLARELGAGGADRGSGPDAGGPGLTPDGHAVLDVIEEAEQGGATATVGSVADEMGVDRPRASTLVAAAVRAGFVHRRADQDDGRRAPLVLSAAGRHHLEHVHNLRRRRFAEAMARWTPAERAEFARLLTAFVTALDAGR
jgi:DNA-binding MarR family transcriptional regulator